MHNTVTVDGFSQHTFNANNIFKMSYDTKSVLKDWKTNDLIDIIQIEHNGYTRLSNPVIHERTIKFDKINNEITIIDKLTGVGKHLFEIFFYFSDLLEISMIHSKKVEVNSNHLKTLISFESDSLFNISKEDCSISYSYGTKIKSKKIVVKSHELCPFCLSTKIKPL
ncbi:hypothetical protein SDC9_182675 [bioreactor metagenome]|uniref:Heparinase II/III-like C-terminal domain-containing protein n=1 Tax=bioreactor metagenome TaxID=1076179 RepID=A0A645H904_9ZZZZ